MAKISVIIITIIILLECADFPVFLRASARQEGFGAVDRRGAEGCHQWCQKWLEHDGGAVRGSGRDLLYYYYYLWHCISTAEES